MIRSIGLLALAISLLMVSALASPTTYIQIGPNVPPTVAKRAKQLLSSTSPFPVEYLQPWHLPNYSELQPGSVLFTFGRTAVAEKVIPMHQLSELPAESYIIRANTHLLNDTVVLAGDGTATGKFASSLLAAGVDPEASLGAAYATYAILEKIGFAFLHPLEPVIPTNWSIHRTVGLNESRQPNWDTRLWHVHTMHPLELTDMLNGFDIPLTRTPLVPRTANTTLPGTGARQLRYEESFHSMLTRDWELFLEWITANRQNAVEWVLLLSPDWMEFGLSPLRQERLRQLVDACHGFGIACGFDVPIALIQQHSFTMIGRPEGRNDENYDPVKKMRENIDWWLEAGADFLTTENGFSEFTKGSCTTMLNWMNEATAYLAEAGRSLHIKVHISKNQVCEEFLDPVTGQPLNFNFLPTLADKRLGILPHTVQMYTYGDPAPTYAQESFDFMYDFMFEEMRKGEREVVFYPETAYWITYDIQSPLFLPLYAWNRFRDLRLIAEKEKEFNTKISGQMIFESGWEWGYWINNVVAARAVFDPLLHINSTTLAFQELLRDALYVLDFKPLNAAGGLPEFWAEARRPVGIPPVVDATNAAPVVDLLYRYILEQDNLLVQGIVNGKRPSDIIKRNGIAYIEGWDTFADFGAMTDGFISTQPVRMSLLDFRRDPPKTDNPDYLSEIRPLLVAMDVVFNDYTKRMASLLSRISPLGRSLVEEIVDSMEITAVRALQVRALFDYASTWSEGNTGRRKAWLSEAEAAMEVAKTVLNIRQGQYRTPLERIAGWRRNPTVYLNTYLWPAKSMIYFWRDYDQARYLSHDVTSPCYMNYINPIVVAFGEGDLHDLLVKLRKLADRKDPGNHYWLDCATAPLKEPTYPLPVSGAYTRWSDFFFREADAA